MVRRSAVVVVVLVVCVFAGGFPAIPASASASPSVATSAAVPAPVPGPRVSWGGGGVEPLVPARLLDTRPGGGLPDVPVGAKGVVTVDVTGRGGVPDTGVGAVVLNVTAVGATAATHLTVWPTGAARPNASSLNVAAGQTVPNLVVAKVGVDGQVSIFNNAGTVDVLADVTGWFPETGGVEPLVPARILDTRPGNGPPDTPVAAKGVVTVDVTGRGGVPDTGVGAVVLNVTAVGATAPTHLTVWPTGETRPNASSLNVAAGQTVPNLVIAKVGADGTVSIFNNAGTADVLADVTGWFPDVVAPTVVQPWADTTLLRAGDLIAVSGGTETGGTITLAASADVPVVGDPVAVLPSSVDPDGSVGIVESVAGNVVTYGTATVGDAFADYEIDYDGPLSETPVGGGRFGLSPTWGFDINDVLSCSSSGHTIDVDFDMADIGAVAELDLSERLVHIELTATPTLTVGASWSGSVSCTFSQEVGKWPIGPTGLFVVPSLEGGITASASAAEGSATASAPITIGFHYDPVSGPVNLSDADLDGSAQFDSDEEADLTFSAGVGLSIELADIVGVGAAFTMDLGFHLRPFEDPCLVVDLRPTVSVNVTIETWIADWSFDVGSWSGPPVTLYEANPEPPCSGLRWVGYITVTHTEPTAVVNPRPPDDYDSYGPMTWSWTVSSDTDIDQYASELDTELHDFHYEQESLAGGCFGKNTVDDLPGTTLEGDLGLSYLPGPGGFIQFLPYLAAIDTRLEVTGGPCFEPYERNDWSAWMSTIDGEPANNYGYVILPIDETGVRSAGTFTRQGERGVVCGELGCLYADATETITWDLRLV